MMDWCSGSAHGEPPILNNQSVCNSLFSELRGAFLVELLVFALEEHANDLVGRGRRRLFMCVMQV